MPGYVPIRGAQDNGGRTGLGLLSVGRWPKAAWATDPCHHGEQAAQNKDVHNITVQRTNLGDKCTDTNGEQNQRAVDCGSWPKHEQHAHQLGRTGEVAEPLSKADLAKLDYHHWRSAQLEKRSSAE